MPPALALLLCILFIGWIFHRETRAARDEAGGSWIPAFWFASITARPLSYWIGFGVESGTRAEGNPVEAIVHLAFLATALATLTKRRVAWASIVSSNAPLMLLLGYFIVSALWSELPIPSLRRIFKEFIQLAVLLLVLTEHTPLISLMKTISRTAFLLLPLSFVLIRYYGAVGREYHHSTGETMFVGVAGQKNSLGALALISIIALACLLIHRRKRLGLCRYHVHQIIVLGIAIYLLWLSNSKTSLVCLVVAVTTVAINRLALFREIPGSFFIQSG